MEISSVSYRHLKIATFWVLGVLIIGTLGYALIENLSPLDALYTAIEMISTGGNVVAPLSLYGRIFTIFITILGVGSLFYAFSVGMEFMIEGHLNRTIRRRFMENKIAALRNHYVVCGFGRVGSQIAEEFAASRMPFVVIDENEDNVQRCIQRGYLALQGDATSDDTLRAAGIQYAKCLLAATDADANNIYITLSARNLNTTLLIVARANHTEAEPKLKLAGADRIISPYTIGGHRMANVALQPGVIELFDFMTKGGNTELAVREVFLAANSPLVGKTMPEVQNMLEEGAFLVAVRKPDRLVTGTRKEVRIEKDDVVIVVGHPKQLETFARANASKPNRTSIF